MDATGKRIYCRVNREESVLSSNHKLSIIEIVLLVATFIIIGVVGFAIHQAGSGVATDGAAVARGATIEGKNVHR
ncbi:hypothetical protein BRC19_00510 [Candidatus Saccharibacteria bacterium QS_5_54_17]|nr:MAG: hypothetical protein BRC19_00510 [Candidatus Saccharibacteria bacterium QS_5_54_17]